MSSVLATRRSTDRLAPPGGSEKAWRNRTLTVEIEEYLPRKVASKFLPFDVAVRRH